MIPIYDNMLPTGWEEEELRNVTLRKRGYSWAKEDEADRQDATTVPVIRIPNIQKKLELSNLLHIRNVSAEALRESAITKDWIIFVGSNGNPNRIGDSALMTEDREMVFASFLMAIASKSPERITPQFLAAWLRLHLVHEAFSKTSQQTTGLANFSWSAVKRLPLRYPKKKQEQDGITNLLDTADAVIAAAEAKLAAARRLKTALMQQLFTRGIPSRHTHFQQTKVGEIPEGWELKTLAAHCGGPDCVRTGPFGAQLPLEAFANTGIRMVNITDIGEGELDLTSDFYVRPEVFDRLKDYSLVEGDVVFSRVASVGRLGLIHKEHEPLLMSSNCIRLRPRGAFNSKFLTHVFLDAESVARQVEAMSNAGARPIVTPRFLRRMLIPRPPRDEQDEIASLIEAADANVRGVRSEITALERLKRSLLQNLLTGRVRVRVES